jgi:hypothetical protein
MPLISVVTANSEARPLRLAEEVREIRMALGQGSNFSVVHDSEITAANLIAHLLHHEPDILHFSGHGADEGDEVLVLSKEGGGRSIITSGNLRNLFAHLPHRPKLVILNACYSVEIARVISEHVPVVIGMSGAIPDQVALRFTSQLYQAIGQSCSIRQAIELTRCEFDANELRGDLIRVDAQDEADLDAVRFFARPELMAKFVLDKKRRPEMYKDHFKIDLWMRGVDQNIEAVTFQICHDSFAKKERFWEVARSEHAAFWTEDFHTTGDVTIRATAWSSGRGVGVETTVSNALRRFYDSQADARFVRVIEELAMR